MTSHLKLRHSALPSTWLGRAALLLLLVAGPASAQAVRGPRLAPMGPPLITPGEATSLGDAPSAPGTERPHAVARVGAELGGSLMGAIGLGVTGAMSGGVLSLALCGSTDNSRSLNFSELCLPGGAALGSALGVAVGVPLGAWWGGGKAGGNGRFLGAFGGMSVSLASAGTAYALGADDLGLVLLAAAPVFSIVGYELTDSAPKPQTATSVAPSLSVNSGGASFGLQGRF